MTDAPMNARIETEILRLVSDRGPGSSISPSEVAQTLDANWRPLLRSVRTISAALARSGQIDILRKGRPIDPDDARGVIRLRIRSPAT
jgi:hypothetical protein